MYPNRRFPRWAPWAAGVAGGSVILGLQFGPVRREVESDLTASSRTILRTHAVDVAQVQFTGQEAQVSGATSTDEVAVTELLLQVPGVHKVTFVAEPTAEPSAADTAPETQPRTTSDPTSSQPGSPPSPQPGSSPGSSDGSLPDPQPTSPASEISTDQTSALVAQLGTAGPLFFAPAAVTPLTQSLPVLDELARIILAGPQSAVYQVQGFTDSHGDPQTNQVLSEQRALWVRQALMDRGVPSAQLLTTGFGESQLLNDAELTEADMQLHRQVSITLVI